jgi:hypothetical protein
MLLAGKGGTMPILSKDSTKEWEPAPEGLHQAVCVDVVDRGLKETPWGPKHQVQVRWMLGEMLDTYDAPQLLRDGEGKPFLVMQTYTNSLNEKARLRQHLDAWRGRKFTAEELKEGFDLERLIGAACQLQVVHDLSDSGRTYANVQAVVPLGKGMAKLDGDAEYVRDQDRQRDVRPGSPATDEDIPF